MGSFLWLGHTLGFLSTLNFFVNVQEMAKGTKRGSPGAEEQKSPLADVVLSDDDAKKLTDIQKDLARAELILGVYLWASKRVLGGANLLISCVERQAQARLRPVYEKRREITKKIPNFWPVALKNHSLIDYHIQHTVDQTALTYLEDVWVEKDPKEHRCFTIEFVSCLVISDDIVW